jgi:hypothetical protein
MVRSILTLAIDAFYKDDLIRDRYAQAFTDGFGSTAWSSMPTLNDFIGYCSYERLRMDGVSEDVKAAMNRVKVRLNFWLTSRIGKSISRPSTFEQMPSCSSLPWPTSVTMKMPQSSALVLTRQHYAEH